MNLEHGRRTIVHPQELTVRPRARLLRHRNHGEEEARKVDMAARSLPCSPLSTYSVRRPVVANRTAVLHLRKVLEFGRVTSSTILIAMVRQVPLRGVP